MMINGNNDDDDSDGGRYGRRDGSRKREKRWRSHWAQVVNVKNNQD
jgi:hypothetical protein